MSLSSRRPSSFRPPNGISRLLLLAAVAVEVELELSELCCLLFIDRLALGAETGRRAVPAAVVVVVVVVVFAYRRNLKRFVCI